MEWLRKYLSGDDLMSVVGYVALVFVARIVNPETSLAAASMLVSGMLTLFWVFSRSARERTAESNPNVRVGFWFAIAVLSGAVVWAMR